VRLAGTCLRDTGVSTRELCGEQACRKAMVSTPFYAFRSVLRNEVHVRGALLLLLTMPLLMCRRACGTLARLALYW
jgi:hypothetical protein